MRYPGLPAAGSGPADSGWALAGSELPRATVLLTAPRDAAGRVQLAEVLRRRFDAVAALRVLEVGLAETPTVDELLCAGNVAWTVGDGARAETWFTAARRHARATGDPAARLAAALGLARTARIRYRRTARRRLRAAAALGPAVDDGDLLADLDRERAAWALLAGDADTALRLAGRAAAVHRAAGDDYLAALADLLTARARTAEHDRAGALELVRAQVEVGRRIGSWDVEQIAEVYLGQFLQRGAAPGTAQWAEAEQVLTGLLTGPVDPFTRAEVLLPLAHLHTMSGEFPLADAELTAYEGLYAALGGNQVSAGNLLKARARLELARHGGGSLRDLRRSPRAAAAVAGALLDLRRAAWTYRLAGFRAGGDSVVRHIDTLVAVTGGRPLRGLGRRRAPRADDPLDTALHLMAGGARDGARHRPERAAAAYAAAEEQATAAGATVLAALAAAARAEAAHARGDRAEALAAVRAGVAHAESVRAGVTAGTARSGIAGVIAGHYERALLLAARLDDPPLAFELVERLRTERLAGLLRRRETALPADVAVLLGELDEVNEALLLQEPGVAGTGTTRAVRELATGAATALRRRRAELHAQLGERTTTLFADTFGAEPLRARLDPPTEDVLELVPLGSGRGEVVVAVWARAATGGAAVTVTPVGPRLAHLRDVLTATGDAAVDARRRLTWADLDPVGALLPPALRSRLSGAGAPVRLVVVPTGWTWAVPFAAVPLDPLGGRLLVDAADLVLAPSLRFTAALRARPPAPAGPAAAVSWVDPDAGFAAPEIAHLAAHPGGHTALPVPDALREAFVRGGERWRTAVVAAHGNREPGLAQAVVAAGRSVLSAADFLDGRADPPRFVSFASCHSGCPDGDDPHEPLGLALAALAAGAEHVLSAHVELAGQGTGTLVDCLGRLYAELPHDADVPAALARVLRAAGSRARHRPEPLYRWAALAVIGTHPAPTTTIPAHAHGDAKVSG